MFRSNLSFQDIQTTVNMLGFLKFHQISVKGFSSAAKQTHTHFSSAKFPSFFTMVEQVTSFIFLFPFVSIVLSFVSIWYVLLLLFREEKIRWGLWIFLGDDISCCCWWWYGLFLRDFLFSLKKKKSRFFVFVLWG